jgi:small-conductance mechanosensitive channel
MNVPELFGEVHVAWAAAGSLALLVLAAAVGLIASGFLARALSRRASSTPFAWDDVVVRHWKGPIRLMIPLLVVLLVTPVLPIPGQVSPFLRQLTGLVLIVAFAWLGIQTVFVFRDLVLGKYDISVRDNLRARTIYTQIRVIERVLVVVIVIIAVSSMLMTFDKVRQFGVSILASAGIAGIVLGFAAQRSLATLFAGIQIAFTQPIRIDDVLIVENEWGRVEEITLTYVVVRIWDLRRLVVPITYFIERPFQNWTRVTADLLGTVFLYADYTIPVQEVREELHRVLEGSDLWDKKVWGLQVTNANERTVEMRALMSAPDAPTAWNLRCEVREKLLAFVQEKYPGSLPRVRAELAGEGAASG